MTTNDGRLRVAHTLPDFDVGGGQIILKRTLEAMDADRFSHLVVGIRGGPLAEAFQAAGLRCEILGVDRARQHPRALRALAQLLRDERIDVVHSLNHPLDRAYALASGRWCRLPVVIWLMSLAVPLYPFPPPVGRRLTAAKGLALYPAQYASYRQAASIVALSSAVASSYADHLRLHPEDIGVVAPGLAPEAYTATLDDEGRRRLRRQLGIDNAHPVLLNVGMLIELKGQQHLVPMMRRLRDALPEGHLLVVGEGPNRGRLEELIVEEGVADRVTLLGHRSDVHELLQVADVLVSASNQEGFGMAVLEAMAMGLPVVAARTPAFEEFLVEEETALLVDQPDQVVLADAVRRLFAEPARAGRLGAAGRELARAHTVAATAERLGEVLASATRQPGADEGLVEPASRTPREACGSTYRL